MSITNKHITEIRDPDKPDVIKVQEGDISAYKNLIERNKEKVRNLIWSMTNNQAVTDELTQEVFIKAFYSIKSFSAKAKFSTWLYTITLNKVRDYLRKKRIQSIFMPLDYAKEEKTLLNIAEKKESEEIIRKEINKLSPKLREILILRDIEGMSYDEIGEILKCGEGTVKSRLFRAREELKKRLMKYDGILDE